KYDNFDKRIKKFNKDDLYVSIINCFDAFKVNGIAKNIDNYGNFVNENRYNYRIKESYSAENNVLILVFDFDENSKEHCFIGAYNNLNTLIEHYNKLAKESNVDVEELQYLAFEKPINKISVNGLIPLTFEGGMLSAICLEELFDFKEGLNNG
ncbi:hypothetical protein LLE89_05645, partial [Staphylococcus epidermidis]